MTNKEAIETIQIIQKTFIGEKAKKALDMAVTLLKEDTIERWRDAEWPRDAANPPKEARFSYDREKWEEFPLTGFALGEWFSKAASWNYCQVRDE